MNSNAKTKYPLFLAAALPSAPLARAQVTAFTRTASMNRRGAKSHLLSVRLALGLLLSSGSIAWAVTFQFTGQVAQVNGPGADVISNVVAVGMPCSGTVTYDPQAASAEPHAPGTEAYYDFKGTDMRITLIVGTNVFTSTDSSSCQVEVIYKIWSPISDGLSYQAIGALLNGGALPGATDSQTLKIEMLTTNLDALSSDALPTQPPQLDSFVVVPGVGYRDVVFYTYKGGSFDYGLYANLTSITAPPVLQITSQPQNQTVLAGSNVTFSLIAIGTAPLSYQWRLDGTAIPGATNAAYVLENALPISTNATLMDLYDAIVTDSSGSVTSAVATLSVLVPPYILAQPLSQTVAPSNNVTFNVNAVGTAPLSYQWRYNGVPLSGPAAQTPTYNVLNAQWANTGLYDVLVTNMAGAVTSQVAVLAVRDLSQPVISVPSNLVATCTGPGGATVTFAVSATDRYGATAALSCSPPSGSMFPIGYTTVTCGASDSLGNTNTSFFTVQVVGTCDAGYIAISCPSNVQATLGPLATIAVKFEVHATNLNNGQPYPVQCTPPSGSQFPVGTNLVTCVASAGGGSNVCTFAVVVNDVTAPTLHTPPSIVTVSHATNALGQAGAYVNFQVFAADNSGLVLSYYPPSGSFFPVGSNLVTCVARDASGNTTTTTFPVVVQPGFNAALCPDVDNWGFENPCFGGWTASGGDAFTYNPVTGAYFTVKRIPELQQQMLNNIGGDYWPNLYYSVGQKGSNWICTAYVPNTGPGGNLDNLFDDTLTGTLVSKKFAIPDSYPGSYISFLIGGGQDDANLRVELLVESNSGSVFFAGTNYSIFDYRTGHNHELMRRDWWDVSTLRGAWARIRILDTSQTGHLNVDDFRFQNIIPSAQTVALGASNFPAVVTLNGDYYDWDSPVWGFADMHTHPMSYLGFGQKLFHGQPDGGANNPGDFTIGLNNCQCDHEGYDLLNNQCGDFYRQLIMSFTDDGGLNPHGAGWDANPWAGFRDWPVFATLSHQQMWYDWIKRAYDGGERVLVALCVNNRLLATAAKGDPNAPHDDKSVGNLQIMELKNFVSRHDFMEIAYDPFQLRDIVRRNKLAIIIGSELDDIGNLVTDPTIDPWDLNPEMGGGLDPHSMAMVRSEIQQLYDQGLRYVFPVHLTDNKFAGSAIAEDMLNPATKFMTGSGFVVQWAAQEDQINFWLGSMDFTTYLPKIGLTQGDVLAISDVIIFGGPLLPLVLPLLQAVASQFELSPAGAGAASAAGLLPIVGAVVLCGGTDALLRDLLTLAGVGPSDIVEIVNAKILPLPGNYPAYPDKTQAQFGIRNNRGLTPLGEYAVKEMMRHGMMIDVDHMSQNTLDGVYTPDGVLLLDGVLTIATNVPGGYPLNFGHNGFRDLGSGGKGPENSRSLSQLQRLQPLGGLMGVGWEDGKGGTIGETFADLVHKPQFSISVIANNCGGTSKTWAQSYLYALEQLQGQNVAFGTDADGMIQFPGPRFGPQSAYGLSGADIPNRSAQIEAQVNGVLYSPTNGHALTTAAFRGRAVQTDNQNDFADPSQGYEYNLDQADFYSALNIFYWFQPMVVAPNGWDSTAIQQNVDEMAYSLSGNYPGKFSDFDPFGGSRARIADYACGLLGGIHNQCFGEGGIGHCGWDDTPDKNERQQLGKAVYQNQVQGTGLPNALVCDRLTRLLTVWAHYQKIFGANAPMIRCQTDFKQWDINFEGVAHYGLIPDFLQDLSNVGMQAPDMSVLFRSAEYFAQMWTKCLEGAYTFVPHFTGAPQVRPSGGGVFLSYTAGGEDYTVEETGNLQDPLSWQPANITAVATNGFTRTIQVPPTANVKFYRLRKP